MKASWGGTETTVNSTDGLKTVIALVRKAGRPTMVFLEAQNGNVLVFGVGQDESALTFAQPDGTSFHSFGDRERKGYLHYQCRDQMDEFMTEMAVPESDALVAAEQFLTTNERPSAVVVGARLVALGCSGSKGAPCCPSLSTPLSSIDLYRPR